MATATVPVKLFVVVALVVTLVLGLAIGYVISDATRSDGPMQMTSGMDMGDMGDMGEHAAAMNAHMEEMGMASMMGSGPRGGPTKDMPAMHGHD